MSKEKTKVKRKLKLYNFIIVCLFLCFFSLLGIYFYQMPIKNIIITGTYYLSDKRQEFVIILSYFKQVLGK